jgi:multidrug efflux pump subunit AcrB
VTFGGDIEEQMKSFRDLTLLLVLAIALVYIVMAAQFESFRGPFIIMFAIPFAFVGVIWAFLVTGTTLNMVSFMGMVMLMGIVVNNAIVLVDYTNIMRRRGLGIREALMTSGRRRLRPVLMTAFTTMFGMLPLAVSRSEGAEMWNPLGVAMIGGLLVATAVTLVLVPTIYSLLEGRRSRTQEVKE